MSLSSSVASSVSAYALIMVAGRESTSLTLSVISRSDIPTGSAVNWVPNELLTAKPTPCILGSFSYFPFQ